MTDLMIFIKINNLSALATASFGPVQPNMGSAISENISTHDTTSELSQKFKLCREYHKREAFILFPHDHDEHNPV